MNGKIFFASVLVFIASTSLFAQTDTPFEKGLFKERKDEFKVANDAFKEGLKILERTENYQEALPLFIKANDFNPNYSELNYNLGLCIIKAPNTDKSEAIQYLEKALKLKPTINPYVYGLLGIAYHFNYEWDKAISAYNKYSATLTDVDIMIKKLIKRKIEECENGKELYAEPIRVFVDNLGTNVNSKYPDYGPVITTDESQVYFTSRRADSYGGKKEDNEFYEDVYYSFKKGKDFTPSVNLGEPINTEGHESVVAITPDGGKMILYRGDGDLYISEKKQSMWQKPQRLPEAINTVLSLETSASLSYDGNTIIFVSDRKDKSLGGSDIFISTKDSITQKWSEAQNLGPNVNTEYNEEGAFLHPDGKTLYFSSKGHNTMGDYDIFISVLENGKWSKAKNIGYPINTPGADVYFVVNSNGRRGYYASYNKNGFGEKDVYVVTILGPEKQFLLNTKQLLWTGIDQPTSSIIPEPKVKVSSNQLTLFRGYVFDSADAKPVVSYIELFDNTTNKLISTFEPDLLTGKFLLTLPSGRNYGVAVKADGYLFHSENFNLPPGGDFQEVVKTILLKKIVKGKSIILRNIFFDYNKATLRNESITELENVLKLLSENPKIKVEISGHTDNVGGDAYNQKLSENRAKAVVDYLVTKGIQPDRLTFIGYGSLKPLADNTTEEGRQSNRRTELKILD